MPANLHKAIYYINKETKYQNITLKTKYKKYEKFCIYK